MREGAMGTEGDRAAGRRLVDQSRRATRRGISCRGRSKGCPPRNVVEAANRRDGLLFSRVSIDFAHAVRAILQTHAGTGKSICVLIR